MDRRKHCQQLPHYSCEVYVLHRSQVDRQNRIFNQCLLKLVVMITEEEVGRQHQRVDRAGVRQLPEGCGEQGQMEGWLQSRQWYVPNDPYGSREKLYFEGT